MKSGQYDIWRQSLIVMMRGKWHFCTVSHCDGIIWLSPLSFYYGETVLYNPGIREFKFLPGSCLAEAYSLGRFILVQGEGFGYDSKVNDYKFIRILSNWRSNECIAELYSMASDSWREIRSDMKFGHALCGGNRVVVCWKGFFYWVVKVPDIILAFEMSSDEFHSIQLTVPHNVDQVDALPSTRKILAVWNESVAHLRRSSYMY
ncbi:F-box associated interaction domain containing protein [Parasponia andersonii]|uniref:F-box associated interaction domain containing protein n=1 Tax=Parasponia andersonii TaxID=3476 RepID=A0A2P5B1C8_PARAD|nr:F-box associated interaction domain containing protein [Parasponia andersonii]